MVVIGIPVVIVAIIAIIASTIVACVVSVIAAFLLPGMTGNPAPRLLLMDRIRKRSPLKAARVSILHERAHSTAFSFAHSRILIIALIARHRRVHKRRENIPYLCIAELIFSKTFDDLRSDIRRNLSGADRCADCYCSLNCSDGFLRKGPYHGSNNEQNGDGSGEPARLII